MAKPADFDWVVPGVLAAMGLPPDTRRALEFFQDEGIGVIVTLMERPLNRALVEEFGFEYHHIPIEDFSPPSLEQAREFVQVVESAREAGRRTIVHCLAGRGRTGTMAACYLVGAGCAPRDAIRRIRDLRPGSIETYAQERAVFRYARSLRDDKRGKG